MSAKVRKKAEYLNEAQYGVKYVGADDDDNANSFDAIAFLLCILETGTTFIVNHSHGSRWNLLEAFTFQQQPQVKKRVDELKMRIFVMCFCYVRFERLLVSIMKCMDFYRYRVIFDYISPATFFLSHIGRSIESVLAGSGCIVWDARADLMHNM